MRASILEDFDDVVALDLGGNRRRRGRDENLFDIAQGVAAVLLVRGVTRAPGIRRAGVLRGGRAAKTALLSARPLLALAGDEISPCAPAFELRRRDADLATEFSRGDSLAELFALHGPGVVTSRDDVATARDEGVLRERIEWLLDPALSDDEVRARLGGVRDTRAWQLGPARAALRRDRSGIAITPYLYRPFERRFACLHPALVERPRRSVMRHLRGEGALALVAMRQVALDDAPYSHVLVTDCPVDNRVMYSNRGIVSVFPLWLEPDGATGADAPRRSGLDARFVARLAALRGAAVAPLEAFDLILGTLMSRGYRERFAECLALELPRVPLPRSRGELEERVALGEQLRELLLGLRAPPEGSSDRAPSWLGGYAPERLIERATDPRRARAVLEAMP
jgi:predicted helicase